MSDIVFHPLGQPATAGAGLGAAADIDPRLTRTHYFDGRLLTAEDLTRDQIYVDQRLRELGRVVGSGIMRGLELAFDRFTGMLTLQPGQCLTAAGRVLELGTTLVVDLGDRALITGLNDGSYGRLDRGLYAVVLRYVDVGSGSAEVFPKDLGAKRGFQYALIKESVQLGLVPLPLPLPLQNPLQIRSRLLRDLRGDSASSSLIPEDAVALGVLAVQDDAPQWLDAELLRHPVRAEPGPGDLQADLSRAYEKLLLDILNERRGGSLSGDFHAADYFSLLPPVGTLPKDSVDPINGRQSYFPENFQVAIAPIRQADVELIKAESLDLPPIDLSSSEPVDVVVLAPLSNQEYGSFANQLERVYDPASRRLPQVDLLSLKVNPAKPVHGLVTDAAIWTEIWDRVAQAGPFYVRRPIRAAETALSGMVLALGADVPEPTQDDETPSPADSGDLIQDVDTIFLSRLNLTTLATLRPPRDPAGSDALQALQTDFASDVQKVLQSASLLMRIERRYDPVVWQTLLALANGNQLASLLSGLQTDDETATPGVIATLGQELGLDANLLNQWAALTP
jgi:hypothetical protein